MKKWMFVFAAGTLIMTACNNEKKEGTETVASAPAKTVALSLPANYSSSFEMGNPEYAAMIVQGSWKDWQDNKLDNMKNWMADTVMALQSDNQMIKGLDSMMATWKRDRAAYSSVVDSIDAAMAVYSTDKKENWVLVWAQEFSAKADGTKDTTAVQETWRINKAGKADFLLQYNRHKRKQ